MSYVSGDPNYTDRGNNENSVNSGSEEPPAHEAMNSHVASKLANLLECLNIFNYRRKDKDHTIECLRL